MGRTLPKMDGLMIAGTIYVKEADAREVVNSVMAQQKDQIENQADEIGRLQRQIVKIAYVARKASLCDAEKLDDIRGMTPDPLPSELSTQKGPEQ